MVGPGRAPCMEDRLRMPYTNAVLHELQRIPRAGIESFPRMTTQDVEFRGHTIPKVTLGALHPRGRTAAGLE